MSSATTARPQWIPRKGDVSGLSLAGGLGALSILIARLLPPSPLFSDLLLAILLGALVLNVAPLRRLLRVGALGDDREPDRHAAGLRFIGKWVLRAAIILLGLKIDARQVRLGELALIGGVLVATLPSTFMLVHALAAPLGVRRQLADLVASGTMICGASAVNATAPVVGARRQEQGVAIATVFLFSVVALFTFRPLAMWIGLGPQAAGLWGGLAVNDLSSAVAVGGQMGDAGAAMAAASKSARVLLLGPMLLFFSFLRRDGAKPKEIKGKMGDVFPLFVLGFVGLAILRAIGDKALAGVPAWSSFLFVSRLAVDLLMATVAVAIGLHLEFAKLFAAGAQTLALGGVASTWMAGTSLALVTLASRGQTAAAALAGIAVVAVAFLAFKFLATSEAEAKALRVRFAAGAPFSLWEATRLLTSLESDGTLGDAQLRQLMLQLHPSIGELIPIRSSPLPHGAGCRWLTYWEGKTGWALVALAREAKSQTPIHAHPHRLMGKSIEGQMEELRFAESELGARLEFVGRRLLTHNDLIETEALATVHLVRVVGDSAAIDLQLRGPESGQPGRRYRPVGPFDPDTVRVGANLAVSRETDDRPGHGGEGAHGGVLPTLAMSGTS